MSDGRMCWPAACRPATVRCGAERRHWRQPRINQFTVLGSERAGQAGRDVLSQEGIKAVILFEGTNDIGQPDTPVLRRGILA